MIVFDQVTVTYGGPFGLAAEPALRDVTLHVPEGELTLVIGATGSGKSTLLRAACGLVPHFTGGLLEGRVLMAGRDTRNHLPRDLADVVGVVAQNPAAAFVTDTVEDELAYGMEQLGLPPEVMRKRVEEVLDLLGLAPLRHRPLADLSGGEQQRTAIGAVLTSGARILVLDEPTSALDPTAAEDVLAALTRLVHDLGMTVLLAEHRLERVVQFADRIISLTDGSAVEGDPAQVLAESVIAPPIVELGRLAGWSPLPLSVRDARRRAAPLRERLTPRAGAPVRGLPDGRLAGANGADAAARGANGTSGDGAAHLLSARDVHVRYGKVPAVRGVDVTLRSGEVVALMGRNGAGKTSLLWALQGSGPRSRGDVRVGTTDPATLRPHEARRHVALVPQDPQALLYLDTVDAECAASDSHGALPAGSTRSVLTDLGVDLAGDAHPRDLSEGQRLALVLAIQLAADPQVLILDEPTRGLDYAAKRQLAAALARHAHRGGAVLLSSHDVEFVADCASRVLVLAEGEIVADGAAREVLIASPTFAPQVAKILHPVDLLTVSAVQDALVEQP